MNTNYEMNGGPNDTSFAWSILYYLIIFSCSLGHWNPEYLKIEKKHNAIDSLENENKIVLVHISRDMCRRELMKTLHCYLEQFISIVDLHTNARIHGLGN